MPRRTILSPAKRIVFEALPTELGELAKHYLLTNEDLDLVSARRRAQNRLGVAVQHCLVRYPGRVLRADEQPPLELVAFVAEQIGTDPSVFGDYARRAQTRRAHVAFLVQQLGSGPAGPGFVATWRGRVIS